MRKTLLITCCLLMCWAKPLSAQPQCTVTHYDEFSGMAQWYVTRIVQDNQGMMWFATWNGLNRYDGYEFVNFKSRAGDGIDMPSDRIRDLVLAADGNLRCKLDDRVFGFCTKTYKFYQISASEEKKMLAIFERKRNEGIVFNKSGEINTYKDIYGTEMNMLGTIPFCRIINELAR